MGTGMADQETDKQKRELHTLAMVNAGIWAIAMIAWVILLQGSGNMKGLFPILGGGIAVAIALISSIAKSES